MFLSALRFTNMKFFFIFPFFNTSSLIVLRHLLFCFRTFLRICFRAHVSFISESSPGRPILCQRVFRCRFFLRNLAINTAFPFYSTAFLLFYILVFKGYSPLYQYFSPPTTGVPGKMSFGSLCFLQFILQLTSTSLISSLFFSR